MRSLTRDPGLANPGGVPPWTIFTQTLIHDFDACSGSTPGRQPVEVYATADALVAPDFKESGLLDTAVVVITFDNGAIASPRPASPPPTGTTSGARCSGRPAWSPRARGPHSCPSHGRGRHVQTVRGDVELFRDAYTAEFVEFIDAVREGRAPAVTGEDARRALASRWPASSRSRRNAPVAKVDGQ